MTNEELSIMISPPVTNLKLNELVFGLYFPITGSAINCLEASGVSASEICSCCFIRVRETWHES